LAVASMVSPRFASVPDYVSSTGPEAVELAAMAGLHLDPWQQFVLEHALGERRDGMWAAKSVGLVVPRQNGKGAILEARELAGLFLLGERLIIHTAHEFATSLEAFRRLLFLIEDTPDLDRRVQRVSRSHGEEGIELKGGSRIRFRTRTGGGGRGFSGDCVLLDEAMILPEKMLGAMLPTLSARPNPQVWYTGSAVDQLVHEEGVSFARVRERGIKGESKSLAFFEWSYDARDGNGHPLGPSQLEKTLDVGSIAEANPGWGVRLNEEWIIDNEWEQMDARTFNVERRGVGDWPATDGTGHQIITAEQWGALADEHSQPLGALCFAFDVAPDRSSAAISVAGKRADGGYHVEVIEHRKGTGWVPKRMAELKTKHRPALVLCDQSGPAASLSPELEALNIEVEAVSARDHANACGLFFDKAAQDELRHLGQPELNAAVRGASTRPLGDAWAWARKTSAVDITTLVAVTLALWGSHTAEVEQVPGWAFA
jgi:hypothetical protein